ncbi:MAG TPA: 1-acyl-sn-glycerol-3-phosphate acyltransferase [Candidatus Adamsella sp.]|nr:1-acyl-sn-glycerol-3-phosphate acyltransferase [Candidatus Adamsella sp.]
MHLLRRVWRSVLISFLFSVFGIGAILINYFIFPIISVFVKKENRRQKFCKTIHKTWKYFTELMKKTGLIKVNFTNPEKLNNPHGKIIVANHPSFIDIVILIGFLPNTLCIAKKEIKRNPFMGNIVKSLYLINDEDNDKMLEESVEILNQGYNIIIFPTGTRTTDGEDLKLHKGAAVMALHTGADIIPIHISCDTKFLAKHQKFYDAGDKTPTYTITVNNEIKTSDFKEQNLTQIQKRNRVNQAIKEKIKSASMN